MACRRNTPAAVGPDAAAPDAGRFVAPTDVGRLTEARRVAAFTPDITETVLALGARDRLVGVPSMEVARSAIEGIARVGTQVTPDMAALTAARPDLVLVAQGPLGVGLSDPLPGGAAIEMLSFEGRAGYAETVTRLALRLGRPAAGAALLARIDGELAAVRRATTSPARPRVVALLHRDPMVVAGPGSFLDELLDVAGARNAVVNTNQFPIVGVEMVTAWAPDVLLDLSGVEGPGVAALIPGPPTRRVVALSPDGMLRPGPRAADAARRLVAALRRR